MAATGERKTRLPEREQKYRRARILKLWMESHEFQGFPVSFSALETLTGLPSSTIAGLLAEYGSYGGDIGTARTETVHSLIRGMQQVDPDLTPETLMKMFEIELPRYQKRWRSALPVGQPAEHVHSGIRVRLHRPMLGHVFAPAGWWASYMPDQLGDPVLWDQEGTLWVLPQSATLVGGRRLGHFLSISPA